MNLKLSQIWIYPIKSLAGVSIKSAEVMEKGLRYDRRLMLIDSDNHFMTQRKISDMALFDVCFENGTLEIRSRVHPNIGKLTLNLDDLKTAARSKTFIWNDEVEVDNLEKSYSEWFSEALSMPCKLVSFPEKNPRRIDRNYVSDEKHVSLSDGYPYLLASESSLNDLSKRVGEELTIHRFRPNFVFAGGEPYEEDSWKRFRIGDIMFDGVKPCARCVLTTVDPETGVKGAEPLKTLATYRSRDGKVYFGQNVVAHSLGIIHVDDEITFDERI